MKKLVLVSAVALVAATLSAAPEKVASVRIGGTEKIVAAVAQIGAYTGNQALGTMFSGSFMQSEIVQYFGPTRAGANVFVQIYADAEKTDDRVSATILYPVVAKKAKFLKHHKKAVEKDGVIAMPADSDGDRTYVVFSEDGQWASLAETPALAKAALGDVAEAERPLGNALLRLDVASRGMQGLCTLAEATRAEGRKPEDRIDRAVLDVLKSVDYLSLGVKVTETGIDFTASAQVKSGTELAKSGLSPYDEKAYAALGSDVFIASAVGKDSLMPRQKAWKDLLAFLRTHGLRPDFIAREEKPGLVRLTLDPVAFGTWASGPATNVLAKLDAKAFAADLQEFMQDKNDASYVAKNPAGALAFSIKGCKGAVTPAERLAAVLPELAGKKLCYVSCGSAYAILRALMPSLLKLAGEEAEMQMTPMLAVLAPDSAPAGVALAAWREGDSRRGVLRISAAEIKGFASCFAMAMACSSKSDADGDEDDSSDGDSGDED